MATIFYTANQLHKLSIIKENGRNVMRENLKTMTLQEKESQELYFKKVLPDDKLVYTENGELDFIECQANVFERMFERSLRGKSIILRSKR